MQEIDTIREQTPGHSEGSQADAPLPAGVPRRSPFLRRFLFVYLLLLALLLLAILPPLLNVNRFKRRIVTSISTSLGRPVHLDSVSLVMLPFPGFKLENFVVAEDPAFGAEPVIRANTVQATLRFSSLWRRKVEFSKISLQEPSINLVHTAQGNWNVESILLQAARIPAAPTAQVKAGPDPRFPYIEATDARVNVKFGDEKLPLSMTEADFALWLPGPQQWRIRMEGKPTRTDTSASDTGTVSLEGTLGRAERFDLIPLDLAAEWKNAPLGEASRVITGRDAGLRGELRLNISAHGTIGSSLIKTTLDLRGARRADFVPQQPLDLRAECQATSTETFHAFHQIRCSWPPPSAPSLLAVTGDLPDIHRPEAAAFELGTPGLPAATLLNWLRTASDRVPQDLTAMGTLTGRMSLDPSAATTSWTGRMDLKGASLAGGPIGDSPITVGPMTISSGAPPEPVAGTSRRNRGHAKETVAPPPAGEFVMTPTTLALGAKEPALLEGRFDRGGYTLHLSGNVLPSRLLALATAIPQFGDGLAAVLPVQGATAPSAAKELPIRIDLTSVRTWTGSRTWSKTVAPPASPHHGNR
jgi:AsmA protein